MSFKILSVQSVETVEVDWVGLQFKVVETVSEEEREVWKSADGVEHQNLAGEYAETYVDELGLFKLIESQHADPQKFRDWLKIFLPDLYNIDSSRTDTLKQIMTIITQAFKGSGEEVIQDGTNVEVSEEFFVNVFRRIETGVADHYKYTNEEFGSKLGVIISDIVANSVFRLLQLTVFSTLEKMYKQHKFESIIFGSAFSNCYTGSKTQGSRMHLVILRLPEFDLDEFQNLFQDELGNHFSGKFKLLKELASKCSPLDYYDPAKYDGFGVTVGWCTSPFGVIVESDSDGGKKRLTDFGVTLHGAKQLYLDPSADLTTEQKSEMKEELRKYRYYLGVCAKNLIGDENPVMGFDLGHLFNDAEAVNKYRTLAFSRPNFVTGLPAAFGHLAVLKLKEGERRSNVKAVA